MIKEKSEEIKKKIKDIKIKDVKVDSTETEFTVNVPNNVGLDDEKLEQAILDKVAEKFVKENYDNVLEFVDIPKLANKVGILIQNKLSIEILRKELEVGFLNKDDVHKDISAEVNGKKYLCEDKKCKCEE